MLNPHPYGPQSILSTFRLIYRVQHTAAGTPSHTGLILNNPILHSQPSPALLKGTLQPSSSAERGDLRETLEIRPVNCWCPLPGKGWEGSLDPHLRVEPLPLCLSAICMRFQPQLCWRSTRTGRLTEKRHSSYTTLGKLSSMLG